MIIPTSRKTLQKLLKRPQISLFSERNRRPLFFPRGQSLVLYFREFLRVQIKETNRNHCKKFKAVFPTQFVHVQTFTLIVFVQICSLNNQVIGLINLLFYLQYHNVCTACGVWTLFYNETKANIIKIHTSYGHLTSLGFIWTYLIAETLNMVSFDPSSVILVKLFCPLALRKVHAPSVCFWPSVHSRVRLALGAIRGQVVSLPRDAPCLSAARLHPLQLPLRPRG